MNLKEIKGGAWEEFSADFPNLAADIEMYRAGSPAVNSLDTIVARRAWSVFERAYVAGAAAEREACAKVCDAWSKRPDDVGGYCAAAIRARGEA